MKRFRTKCDMATEHLGKNIMIEIAHSQRQCITIEMMLSVVNFSSKYMRIFFSYREYFH